VPSRAPGSGSAGALIDLPTVLIALAVFCILRTTRKIPDPVLVALAGVAGLMLSTSV